MINFLFLFSLGFSMLVDKEALEKSKKIAGRDPYFKNVGFFVAMQEGKISLFSGVLIDTEHVITSAHDLVNYDQKRDSLFFLLTNDFQFISGEEGLKRIVDKGNKVEKVYIHEDYRLIQKKYVESGHLRDVFDKTKFVHLTVKCEPKSCRTIKNSEGKIIEQGWGFDLALAVLNQPIKDTGPFLKIANSLDDEGIYRSCGFFNPLLFSQDQSNIKSYKTILTHKIKVNEGVLFEKLYSFFSEDLLPAYENSGQKNSRKFVALVFPGFSGSPVINSQGELVAICERVRGSNCKEELERLMKIAEDKKTIDEKTYLYIKKSMDELKIYSEIYNIFTNLIPCKVWIEEIITKNKENR